MYKKYCDPSRHWIQDNTVSLAAQVTAYIVHNGGHTWPPRPPQLPAAGAQSRNLDATRRIVDFFFPVK